MGASTVWWWTCAFIVTIMVSAETGRVDAQRLQMLRRRDETISSSPQLCATSLTAVTAGSETSTPVPSSPSDHSDVLGLSSLPLSGSGSWYQTSASETSFLRVAERTVSPVASTAINGDAPSATSVGAHARPNALPLEPRITPGLVVGGIILMFAGTAYALIGIKNKWIHVPLSAAFLTGLAVTVLIIYVMNPPVTNAVQGGFVVAVFVTGVVFGALSLIFPEITEGLGCLLGGFCLSMWLLALKPGGLLISSGAKGIVIAAFCVGIYAMSFTHYTRPYALIASTSFGGATAIILGIDCFARAGLKEFWIYLWALNKNVFPLDTVTYPHTRGIRVELASIVFISILGLISQMRLWMVIKDRRQHKAAERLKEEHDREEAEEAIGRRVEQDISGQRVRWEALYGGKDRTYRDHVDSGVVEDFESVHKASTSIMNQHDSGKYEDDVELSELAGRPQRGAVNEAFEKLGDEHKATPVTVRVVQDDDAEAQLADNDELFISTEVRRSSAHTTEVDSVNASSPVAAQDGNNQEPACTFCHSAVPPAPSVVPLPFIIPGAEGLPEGDVHSSISTITGSTVNLRGIPEGTSKSLSGSTSSSGANEHPKVTSASEEALLVPYVEHDAASSVAATLDDLSDSSTSTFLDAQTSPTAPLPTEDDLSLDTEEREPGTGSLREGSSQTIKPSGSIDGGHHAASHMDDPFTATEDKLATGGLDSASIIARAEHSPKEMYDVQPLRGLSSSSASIAAQEEEGTATKISKASELGNVHAVSEANPELPDSSMSDTGPNMPRKEVRPSLSGQLPDHVSKVVMCYRTNEWAKHLDHAEKPELEKLELTEEGVSLLETANDEETRWHQLTPSAPRRSLGSSTDERQQPTGRTTSNKTSHFTDHRQWNGADSSFPGHISMMRTPMPPLQNLAQAQRLANRGLRSTSSPLPHLSPFVSPLDSPNNGNGIISTPSPHPIRNRYPSTSPNQQLAPVPELDTQIMPNDSISISDSRRSPVDDNEEADSMSLRERKQIIQERQRLLLSSQQPQAQVSSHWLDQHFDSHQPKRHSDIDPRRRDAMLAQWRQSLRQDHVPSHSPQRRQSHSTLLGHQDARRLEQSRTQQQSGGRQTPREHTNAMPSLDDERMRQADMLHHHRNAMRKMQAVANLHV